MWTVVDHEAGEGFVGELCPQARTIVQGLENPAAPPVEQMDIQGARDQHLLEAYDVAMPSTPSRVEERQLEADGGGIRVRIYTPSGEGPFPVLVFAHGGCWTFCSLDSHDRLCHYYSHHARCVVVSVDYELAPEHPFPQGLDEFHDAVLWCFEHAHEIQGDSTRIAVAGDSAGGNLAAVVARRLQGYPALRLRLQLLIYPICDISNLVGGSMERYANGYFFTRDILAWTASLYAGDNRRDHSEMSPVYGHVGKRVAPALFIIAECDVLRNQALDYAQQLRESGVDVQCNLYRGVPHAFIAMAGALDLGQQALDESVQHLKHAFS